MPKVEIELEYLLKLLAKGDPKKLRADYRLPEIFPADVYRKPLGGTKRKLSAWNKYVKANSKKPRFRYRNGKLNLKKMAIALRKTPAGRKKKRR